MPGVRLEARGAEGVNPVHFSSASDDWSTPQAFFDSLNQTHRFDLDVCASETNAKCARYFTRADNGLDQQWTGRCFMNPPYGREIGAWVAKAYHSVVSGQADRVVCLIPARTDTFWMHRYILPFVGGAPCTDLAWVAGIVDGEGCIHIRKNAPTAASKHKSVLFDLVLKVSMTDETTVRRLHDLLEVGSVTVDDKKPEGHKTSYNWTCRTGDAQQVLRKLYPYLLTKRHEALRAIEFGFLETARGGRVRTSDELTAARRAFYEELRELKRGLKKGFVAPHVSINFIKGRLKFGGSKNGAPFPSAVAIFRGAA